MRLSEEALAPEDVRKLAAYYAGRPMFAEVRFTVANAIADAILADRAARTPQTPMVGAEPMEAVAWIVHDDPELGDYLTKSREAADRAGLPVTPLYASPLDRASVTVKALEWEDPSPKNNNIWVARTVLGTYCVGCEGGWWYGIMDEGFRPWEWEPADDARSYSGPYAAQAACQADFDKRIRSALKASP